MALYQFGAIRPKIILQPWMVWATIAAIIDMAWLATSRAAKRMVASCKSRVRIFLPYTVVFLITSALFLWWSDECRYTSRLLIMFEPVCAKLTSLVPSKDRRASIPADPTCASGPPMVVVFLNRDRPTAGYQLCTRRGLCREFLPTSLSDLRTVAEIVRTEESVEPYRSRVVFDCRLINWRLGTSFAQATFYGSMPPSSGPQISRWGNVRKQAAVGSSPWHEVNAWIRQTMNKQLAGNSRGTDTAVEFLIHRL
jgi:hypothetical protein